MDASKDGTWERPVEPRAQHGLERAEAQRTEGEAVQPSGRERSIQSERERAAFARSACEQDPDRLLSETANRERDGGGGRRIEPLHVVDDQHDRSGARPLSKEGEERLRDCAPVERNVRLLTEQGDRQGAPLRYRELGSGLVVDPVEQVPKGGEREPRLPIPGPHSRTPYERSLAPAAPDLSNVLFPMPAAPSMTSAPGQASTPATNRSSDSISVSRPTICSISRNVSPPTRASVERVARRVKGLPQTR